MKKNIILSFTLILFFLISSYGQEKSLFSSISYAKSANYGKSQKRFSVTETNGYPKDLKTAKIFFIEINKEDTKGNSDILFGPSFKKINKNVKNKMLKTFGNNFHFFDNDYIEKNKDFFLESGFKYRLLINSTWYSVISNSSQNNNPIWKQNFAIVIEDIETGKIYGYNKWFWYLNYLDKFTKNL